MAGERDDQRACAVTQLIVKLRMTVIWIERHEARPDGVECEQIKKVLGPVFEKHRDSVADAPSAPPEFIGESPGARQRLAIGPFKTVRRI